MARGAEEFEALFPGLLDDMVAAGVPILENRPDCIHFGAAGHVLGPGDSCATSSPHTCPAARTWNGRSGAGRTGIDNVDIVRAGVAEPRFDAARQRVTGVLPRTPASESSPPTSSSTPQAAAPGCRCGWSSGDLSVRPRTASTSASATRRTSCASPTG